MITDGDTLKQYRVERLLGRGGMGEVWLATDSRLDRKVALKILPEDFASDPERRTRFDREARLLASLSHANIAAIHGFEEVEGERFLVLEYVPGKSLAERLAGRALPIEEALTVCCGIARALEAAHARGIIHRDLKPQNVMWSSDGEVKVLDFGLAKAFCAPSSASKVGEEPTVSLVTREHQILGTTPYMSPEQASGRPVDQRTDIWAFGCVFHEALTGQRTFPGATVSETLVAIAGQEPDWGRLPWNTPARIRAVLRRCLEKDADRRLHHIADARIEIEDALAGREWMAPQVDGVAVPKPRPSWLAAAGLLLALGIGAVAGVGLWRGLFAGAPADPAPVIRASINVPSGLDPRQPRISSDGTTLVYAVSDPSIEDPERRRRLHIRRLDRQEESLVPGSEGVKRYTFSPDGKWLAFVALGPAPSTRARLVKVRVEGSVPPLVLTQWPKNGSGLAWLPDGDLVYLTGGAGAQTQTLVRVPADGGPPKPPVEVQLDAFKQSSLNEISALPDRRHVLAMGYGGVGIVNVDTGKSRLLFEDGYRTVWSPTGHLLFAYDGTLLAVPFDPVRLELAGSPVTVLDLDRRDFDISATGTLVYPPWSAGNKSNRILAMADRQGNVELWSEERHAFNHVVVSGDGRRMFVMLQNQETGMFEVWTSDVGSPRLQPFVTEIERDCLYPVLSADGEHLVYYCHRERWIRPEDGIYMRRSDGTGEPTLLWKREPGDHLVPRSLSPDGSWLTFFRWRPAEGTSETLLLPLKGSPDPQVRLLSPDDAHLGWVKFSPDGRWIAYESKDSGRGEIYVRRFSQDGSVGSRSRVSTKGGGWPLWSKSQAEESLELFYFQDEVMMSVSIGPGPGSSISDPRPVLEGKGLRRGDVLPDGRYLAVQDIEVDEKDRGETSRISIVVNWFDELKRKVAAPL